MKEHKAKHKQGPRSTRGQPGTKKKPLPQRARDPKHAKNETGRNPEPERTRKEHLKKQGHQKP